MADLATKTEIERLYAEWRAIPDNVIDSYADSENWLQCPYVTIARQIIEAEPVTPRDVAIQALVDSDDFASDRSERFEALVMRLVGMEVV